MLHYAMVFVMIGLIASLIGMTRVAAAAGRIAWTLFLIGIVLV